jgi:hypothetical protein
MEWLDVLQWPAMAVTLTAAWLVASKARRRRRSGFWLYMVSNVLWIAWGIGAHAYALLILQLGLAAMNIRGERRNNPEKSAPAEEA